MRIFGLVLLLSLAPLSAWSEDTVDDELKALAILSKNCAGCHQTEGHKGAAFLNQKRLSEAATQALVLKAIKTGKMPKAHGDFKDTEDGKKIIAWLEGEKAKRKAQ
jgi:mono/diheme cytochrome c family protein